MLILSFRDDEEHIINHILSYINRETEILHQGDGGSDPFRAGVNTISNPPGEYGRKVETQRN